MSLRPMRLLALVSLLFLTSGDLEGVYDREVALFSFDLLDNSEPRVLA